MAVERNKDWSIVGDVEGHLSHEYLRHVLEECAEASTVCARLMAAKSDVHPADVIRELLSLAGFLEALVRLNGATMPSAMLTKLLRAATDDYSAKLDKLEVANPATLALARELANRFGEQDRPDLDKPVDASEVDVLPTTEPELEPVDSHFVTIRWGTADSEALAIPVPTAPAKSELSSAGPVSVEVPDGRCFGSGRRVNYSHLCEVAGCMQ